jgi:hypothetical protein
MDMSGNEGLPGTAVELGCIPTYQLMLDWTPTSDIMGLAYDARYRRRSKRTPPQIATKIRYPSYY